MNRPTPHHSSRLLLLMSALCGSHAVAFARPMVDDKLAMDAVPVRQILGERAAPAHDTCSGAKVISTLPYLDTVDTSDATADSPPGSCNLGGVLVMQNSVWYKWVCPENCSATITATDLVNYDVILAVYTGTSCANISELLCRDEPEPATLSFNAVKNTTYWFKVGDWGSAPGGGSTQVSLVTSLPNESCETAVQISDAVFTTTINTVVAQAGAGITACGFPGSTQTQNDVWYTFIAPTACDVSVTITPTGFDAILALYHNFGGCNVLVSGNCGHSTSTQSRTIAIEAGEAMSFRIGTYANTPGGGPVGVTFRARAKNDECSGAQFVQCNSVVDAHTEFASNAVNEPVYGCPVGFEHTGFNSLWYRFIPGSPSVRVRTLVVPGGPDDTRLAVYAGSCAGLVEIGCNDDSGVGPDGLTSLIELGNLSVGTQYFVRLSAFNLSDIGHFQLMLECPPDCVVCPASSVFESEVCGDNTNGGCSTSPPSWQDLTLNTSVCGRAYINEASGGAFTVDLDAYRVTIPVAGTLTWTVTAQFAAQISALPPGCPAGAFATATGVACQPVLFQTAVEPGEYVLHVRPFIGPDASELACHTLSAYTARATFTPACKGDFNNDHERNTADLTKFLGQFGQVGPAVLSDLNNDGEVNTLDLTQFLGVFGVPCP